MSQELPIMPKRRQHMEMSRSIRKCPEALSINYSLDKDEYYSSRRFAVPSIDVWTSVVKLALLNRSITYLHQLSHYTNVLIFVAAMN